MCILAMKTRKRPYKSHRWGMHGDVQQPRMLMSANIFKHFGKYTMISQRPYLVPPAVPVAFLSMVLLHLLSARTLEPVWERISERWGASRWPWQKFSDQQNWNENISRLKTVKSSVDSLAKGVFSIVLMSTHSKQLATFARHFPLPLQVEAAVKAGQGNHYMPKYI